MGVLVEACVLLRVGVIIESNFLVHIVVIVVVRSHLIPLSVPPLFLLQMVLNVGRVEGLLGDAVRPQKETRAGGGGGARGVGAGGRIGANTGGQRERKG